MAAERQGGGEPACRTTHHAGCACHEARRDARIAALETALREVCDAHRAEVIGPQGRAQRICDWCYPSPDKAYAWPCSNTECPIGRAFAVLGGVSDGR